MKVIEETKEQRVRNTDTVRAIYDAFGRGDVPAILDRLDDAVEWETQAPVPGVPWLQSRRRKSSIAGFFSGPGALDNHAL